MRAIAFLAFIGMAFAMTPIVRDQRAFEETIINFLECLRGEMQTGWPDFGIPSLDPLESAEKTLELGNLGIEGISGTLTVKNLVFAGLADFVYENLEGSIQLLPPGLTVNLDLIFPNPTLTTEYSGNVQLAEIGIDTFGTGTLDFDANNFKANIGLQATLLGRIGLKYLDVYVSMEPLTSFVITGLRDDEEFSAEFSADMLANGVDKIAELSPKLHDVISDVAMDLINNGGDGGEDSGFISGLIDRCLSLGRRV
nr:uncharacterized protein LOC111422657 [Onthophagus taurus]